MSVPDSRPKAPRARLGSFNAPQERSPSGGTRARGTTPQIRSFWGGHPVTTYINSPGCPPSRSRTVLLGSQCTSAGTVPIRTTGMWDCHTGRTVNLIQVLLIEQGVNSPCTSSSLPSPSLSLSCRACRRSQVQTGCSAGLALPWLRHGGAAEGDRDEKAKPPTFGARTGQESPVPLSQVWDPPNHPPFLGTPGYSWCVERPTSTDAADRAAPGRRDAAASPDAPGWGTSPGACGGDRPFRGRGRVVGW